MSKPSKKPTATPRTPARMMLATVLDTNLPHRRRAFIARRMLRKGLCVERALKALEQMVRNPDASLHGKSLDKAIECLASEAQNYGPQEMLLPKSWEGLIGGLKNQKVRWIPDEEFVRMPKHVKFPDSAESIYKKPSK